MKLEVGMYVRYISGFHHNKSDKPIVMIGKILRIDDYINLDTFFGGGVYPTKEFEKFIKGEPSYNIIDLIEVGDYVNGYRVTEIFPNNRKKNPSTLIYCSYEINNRLYYIGFYNEDIKSIVTKEQFDVMKYEVSK